MPSPPNVLIKPGSHVLGASCKTAAAVSRTVYEKNSRLSTLPSSQEFSTNGHPSLP
jgi:hypothetical protein